MTRGTVPLIILPLNDEGKGSPDHFTAKLAGRALKRRGERLPSSFGARNEGADVLEVLFQPSPVVAELSSRPKTLTPGPSPKGEGRTGKNVGLRLR
jgi:hypothetical protein